MRAVPFSFRQYYGTSSNFCVFSLVISKDLDLDPLHRQDARKTRVKAARAHRFQSLGGRVMHFTTPCGIVSLFVSFMMTGNMPNT
jgi:hypothetical protein